MPDPNPNPNPGNPGEGNPPAEPTKVDWAPHIPQELAGEKLWEPLKDKPLGDVLKGYAEAQKMIGGSVRIPKEDAPPEEWQKFYAKLGAPETPDKYEFKRPALGEGAAWDEAFEKKFLAGAHARGLNSKTVQWLMDLQAGFVEEQLGKLAEKRQEALGALKKDWGEDFERRMTLAGRTRNMFIDKKWITEDQATDLFDGKGIGDDPVFLSLMHRLGEVFAEDGWIKGETGATMLQNVQEQINTIRSDPQDPYNIKDHAKHDERVAFVNKLYERLYPAR